MLLRLKKILSIFTLAVFLLPMVAEQIHAFEHRFENHCTNTETHYCTPKHHCTLCDFVKLTSDTSGTDNQIKADSVLTAHKINFYQAVSLEQPNFNYSLRGPPTAS
jgi:hypothetical protein